MKIQFIRKLIVLTFLFIPVLSLSAQQKPNIILILADDLGYGELGCYGQQMIHTPHIDSLAAAGIRFTNYYAGNSICAPSREALLTGFHTGHTAIRGNFRLDVEVGNLPMAKDHPTIAEYLQKAGYHTAMFGKWGLGSPETGPNTRGFDYSFCYIDQVKAHNYYPPYLWENDKKVMIPENQNEKRKIYSHDLFVNKTLDFIRRAKKDQPFFLYLPYTLPHGDYMLPPDTPYTQKDWPEHFQVYATMVSLLDKSVGRIVQLLKQKGIANNTLILFTSDNGANEGAAKFFNGNSLFRGAKFGLYEGGIREPLIACWPGKIMPEQTSKHIAAAWDILPTICQLTDIHLQIPVDGISFLPALTDGKQKEHDFLYWENYHYNYNWNKPGNELPRNWLDNRAVRMGKWKAVEKDLFKAKTNRIELYNLEKDPSEKRDVAAGHPEIIQKVKQVLDAASWLSRPYFPFEENK